MLKMDKKKGGLSTFLKIKEKKMRSLELLVAEAQKCTDVEIARQKWREARSESPEKKVWGARWIELIDHLGGIENISK